MLAAANLPPHGPIQYSGIWLLIGLALLTTVACWYGFVVWFNRRKPIKSIATLPILSGSSYGNDLKTKYLQLIDRCHQSYLQQEISKRELHKRLSLLVRSFVQEAVYFPATRLTLWDLRLAPYHSLTSVITEYYVDEFAQIEQGDPAKSVQIAKEMVQQWA